MRQFRQEREYEVIRRCVQEQGYPVGAACLALHVSRAGYYRWRSGRVSIRSAENRRIAGMVKEIHTQSPDKGYRRIRDDPQHIAENLLGRRFYADKPNEKWLTDVTELRYYAGPVIHKIYLSAILDLYDRRIAAFVIRDSNDSALVYDTFDQAIGANPDAHPLFQSDRGFQYTTRVFHDKLAAAGMPQSMSRIGKCIDNGPMEGFWGILKRERYYGRRFSSREELVQMIEDYIVYYNSRRLQRGLGVLTPLEKHELYLAA